MLINEILSKARGVFLWVKLAVTKIVDCLKRRDRIPELLKRLYESMRLAEVLVKWGGTFFPGERAKLSESSGQSEQHRIHVRQVLEVVESVFIQQVPINNPFTALRLLKLPSQSDTSEESVEAGQDGLR